MASKPVIVYGARGPMAQPRQYVVIDDRPTNTWHWDPDLASATAFVNHQDADDFAANNPGLFPFSRYYTAKLP